MTGIREQKSCVSMSAKTILVERDFDVHNALMLWPPSTARNHIKDVFGLKSPDYQIINLMRQPI